ncbi:unnamed protein product [Sphagnum jensenii]|uniref:Uncharacterized protein n=1 Tax=Sphagnum jensenii TaxID=128206 RepID=A0ABP1AFV6_9BRYO
MLLDGWSPMDYPPRGLPEVCSAGGAGSPQQGTDSSFCSRQSKSNSMSGVGPKGTDGGNQQIHQQRHRFHDGSGDVGIEASGNRSCQERESGKGSYRDTSVHEIRKLQHSPLSVAKGASTWNTRKVPVGSTFNNWVRRSDDTFLPPEATKLESSWSCHYCSSRHLERQQQFTAMNMSSRQLQTIPQIDVPQETQIEEEIDTDSA